MDKVEYENILKDDSLNLYQKRELLNIRNDQLYQNIYDFEGNILQKTKGIPDLDFDKVVKVDIKDKVVLDLGCNCGKYLFESIKRGAKYAIGVDLQNYMERYVEKLNLKDKVKYVKDDLLTYVPDMEVDIVYLFNMICYYEDKRTILRLIKNIEKYCKDTLIIYDPFSGYSSDKLALILNYLKYKGHDVTCEKGDFFLPIEDGHTHNEYVITVCFAK